MRRWTLVSAALVVAIALAAIGAAPVGADVQILAGNYVAQYYNNTTLAGSPALTRSDPAINFSWGMGAPDPAIVPDGFSARWTGSFLVPTAGTYVFSVTTDDGARLWVDGALLIDKWLNQPATTYTATMALTAAAHTIKLEYYENTGVASIALAWGLPGPADTFNAEYFANITLSGPSFTRVDAAIDFNWAYGAPSPSLPPDYFSVRWTGIVNFPTTGNYDFKMYIDDGARLWLDGVLILDRWYPQPPTEHVATRHVTAGPHQIKMEYFEETQIAVVRLTWGLQGAGADVIVDDLSPGFLKVGPFYQAAIGYGAHMFWTRNATTVPEYWARWTPTLPMAGKFEVYAFIPSNNATTRYARYWVYHSGTWHSSLVNQYIYYNAWVSLGTYQFTGAGGEFAYLNDATGETYLSQRIGFDAAKFVYRGP